MITALLLPTLALMALAVLVTRGIEALVPESPAGLAAIAVLSSLALWLLSAAGFAGLYLIRDAQIAVVLGAAPQAGLRHFLGLGAKAALIWAPLVLLVVATAPRRWKTATW
ncbi:hypothetical protein [Pseudoponticoccus marisrubri]|uniref:Uncharacterized protein n=1 Tax=Pseudoponticoccus marisrubri TaxID=1685382 RepID=A0A0W7WJ22_9RHOB|nr:hypothetical protein [Pseudoponticoccus marisrubri]KUF10610.1 hypothetical protein AVJ23_12090 [Pseudoponticoccus marisrubri]